MFGKGKLMPALGKKKENLPNNILMKIKFQAQIQINKISYRSSKFAEEVESSQSWTIGSDTAQMIGRFKRGRHTSENNGLMDDNLVVILYRILLC